MPGLYNPLLGIYQRFFDFESRRIRKAISNCLRQIPETPIPLKFVSVGTNDGFSNDPFVSWVLKSNCEAAFIEPVPDVFERLKANYLETVGNLSRLTFHQIAISDTSGITKFYAVSPQAKEVLGETIPPWFNQLGSFDRSHISKHLDGVLEPFIYSLDIQTFSLNDFLIKNSFQNLDVLHIDAEGHDYKVLKTLDFSRFCPFIILIEHKHLLAEEKNELMNILNSADYSFKEFKSDILATKKIAS